MLPRVWSAAVMIMRIAAVENGRRPGCRKVMGFPKLTILALVGEWEQFVSASIATMKREAQVTLSIQDLPDNIVASYEATARSRGVPLNEFLRDCLIKNVPPSTPSHALKADEWEKSLDECFDSFPSGEPLSDHAVDRENIYGREDNW